MPATARERMKKKFKVKEIQKKEAKEIMQLEDNLKICIGIYRKKKLIGACIGYGVKKKDFKKDWLYLTKHIDSVILWDVKILKKYDDDEMKLFLDGEKFRITRKKFPKAAYSGTFKKNKKKKAS